MTHPIPKSLEDPVSEPVEDEFIECGIDGCTFAVERGEGRTMALHKDEDHAPVVTPEPSPTTEAAWEALLDALDRSHPAAHDTVLARHRPLIERAVRADAYQSGLLDAEGEYRNKLAAIRAEPRADGLDARAGLAETLLDAVEEAMNSESLPTNIHLRLQAAYDSVVEEANR